jgi:hypothetical protein
MRFLDAAQVDQVLAILDEECRVGTFLRTALREAGAEGFEEVEFLADSQATLEAVPLGLKGDNLWLYSTQARALPTDLAIGVRNARARLGVLHAAWFGETQDFTEVTFVPQPRERLSALAV